ncbi:MAG: hypothetical protein ABI618_17435, partial [Nitrospirota bacterium]
MTTVVDAGGGIISRVSRYERMTYWPTRASCGLAQILRRGLRMTTLGGTTWGTEKKISVRRGVLWLGSDFSAGAQNNGMDSPFKDGITMC